MRRGEILALRWSDLDEDRTIAQVRRSIQPTTSGLVYENPKTRRSRRAVVLPAFLGPYLNRQRAEQARRRAQPGVTWHEHDLEIDRGEGSRSTPTRCPRAGPGSPDVPGCPMSGSTTFVTPTRP
jgi:integrase